jgi:glycine betaine/proline transport system substrate-binding protein
MKSYDLDDHINPVKASYEAGMASALGSYKNGEPIFFYTWAPNWTIFKLKPGKDVMWINVPEIIPKESQKAAVERSVLSAAQIDKLTSPEAVMRLGMPDEPVKERS